MNRKNQKQLCKKNKLINKIMEKEFKEIVDNINNKFDSECLNYFPRIDHLKNIYNI